jgi:hypothetical protein
VSEELEQLSDTVGARLENWRDSARQALPGQTEEAGEVIEPMESVLTMAAAIGAGILTRNLLQASWEKTFDRAPPTNPASPDVAWKEALLWGATAGAAAGIARIVSRRASSHAYRSIRR